ncbi:MAG TPA: molybdate ABC transporter permease subunit [Abditibacteriaceae bacterium]|nr:molybdate ABC transporter permease subunit [Abditibacteriaceae bacterium]
MGIDWQPVLLSLQVAAAALVLAFVAGTLAALLTANRDFWGKSVLEAVFLLPLVLPPVVTGYALLVLAGRQGVLGLWLEHNFGFRLIFTPYAAVLASATVAFPLMYQSARAAFVTIDAHLQDVARSLGANPRRVFFSVTVPLSWPGLLAGAVLSFARALGEFGATIMVAGNIAGRTTTAPTAIYMAAEGGDLRLAGIYSALLAVLNLLFIVGLNVWIRHRRRR